MDSTEIHSIEFCNNYFIDPFTIQTFYESILEEYNNKIRCKIISARDNWLIYYTTLLTVPEDKLTRYKYQDGLYINFYKLNCK